MSGEWAEALLGAAWAEGLRVWPWPLPDWQAVLRRRQLYPIDRKTLTQVLHTQNFPYLARDPALSENLSLLERDSTFTITTGQQVGWLTGPLYTIYKAVSTIQLARLVEAQLGPPYRIVPIFWMASEDHDAEEVNHIATRWDQVWRYGGHFQGPVGRHRIEEAFPPGVESLALQAFYRLGERWEEAFRAAMYALFQGTGLIVLSPDDAILKAISSDLWVAELTSQPTISAHAQAAAHLQAYRQKPYLHPRPINLFWLSDTERRYIPLSEKSDALRAAHTHPHRLSPNVLLRPLYQEYILPDLAYVAGPTEMRYWLELRWVFERFEVFYPVVWPRFCLRVLSEPPVPLTETEMSLLFGSHTGWRQYLVEKWEAALFATWQERFLRLMPDWSLLADLPQAQRAFRYHWQRALQRSRRALYRYLYQKHGTLLTLLSAWRDRVEPPFKVQERFLNIHALAQELPVLQAWIQKLLSYPARPGSWNYLIAPDAAFLQEAG